MLNNVYKQDYSRLIKYLSENMSLEIIPEIEKDIKHLHKKMLAFKCLIDIIRTDKDESKIVFLKETLSDLLQLLPLLINNHYKACFLLFRSSIENFCRNIVSNYTEKKLEDTKNVFDLFHIVLNVNFPIIEIDTNYYFKILRDNYSLLCNYSHSTRTENQYLYETLIEIANFDINTFLELKRRLILVLNSFIFTSSILEINLLKAQFNYKYNLILDNLEKVQFEEFHLALGNPKVLYSTN